jgi:hypothetical protein
MSTDTRCCPRYRALRPVYVNGNVHQPGDVVEFRHWPKASDLEPVNAPARRIARYFNTRQAAWGGILRTPWSAERGDFYLPGQSVQLNGHEPPGVVPDSMLDDGLGELPRYKLAMECLLGGRLFQPGDLVRWVGWPLDEMEPANRAAKQVAAYYATNKDNPKLPKGGPWCWYHGLTLPKLPVSAEPAAPPPDLPMISGGMVRPPLALDRGAGPHSRVGLKELPPYADPNHGGPSPRIWHPRISVKLIGRKPGGAHKES